MCCVKLLRVVFRWVVVPFPGALLFFWLWKLNSKKRKWWEAALAMCMPSNNRLIHLERKRANPFCRDVISAWNVLVFGSISIPILIPEIQIDSLLMRSQKDFERCWNHKRKNPRRVWFLFQRRQFVPIRNSNFWVQTKLKWFQFRFDSYHQMIESWPTRLEANRLDRRTKNRNRNEIK